MMSYEIDVLNERILHCKKCPRLVEWRERVGEKKRRAFREEDYWAKPVPGFGDLNARVLVVGLAPGAHGSNRTGRMFTGDDSGKFLYPALHRAGFSNQQNSTHRCDGLTLRDVYITALCRCVPPGNKPTIQEILTCQEFLQSEIKILNNIQGVVALGKLAYEQIARLIGAGKKDWKPPLFAHGAYIQKESQSPWLLASYHPSRQNTQTKRLTTAMFDQIWETVKKELEK